MKIYKTTLNDIEDLVQLRIDFLKEMKSSISESDEKIIRSQSKIYFAKHLQSGDFIAFLAKTEGQIASVAFLVIQERPANTSFITGITGTLMNVFTYPPYRKKGLATQILQEIVKEAKLLGVSSLDLLATEEGKTLYEKIGFATPSHTSMQMKL